LKRTLSDCDAGALPLARLDLRDVLAAVLAEIAQFVELGVVAGADGAAVGDVERRLVGDGFQDQRPRASGSSSSRSCIARRPRRAGLGVSKPRFSAGIFSSERPSASRSRGPAAQRDFGQQPLDIQNAGQLLAQFGAQDGLLQQFAHGVQARFDFRAVERRPQQALPQQTPAHAGRASDRARQQRAACCCAPASGEERLDQLQIAHRDGVEHHAFGAVVKAGRSR
jgi:hypothetical protein